jgi:hypothetical protein
MDEGMAMNIFREKENMVLVLLSDRVAGFLWLLNQDYVRYDILSESINNNNNNITLT